MKKIKDIVPLSIYDRNINVGMCLDEDNIESWYIDLAHVDKDTGLFPVDALTFYDCEGDLWVLFNKETFNLNTCAHESFHLTHYIMNDIDHSFNIDSHEPHAWLHGYLVDTIFKIGKDLIKQIKKIK